MVKIYSQYTILTSNLLNVIIATMKLILERLKIVCEPSSAVALAALIKERKKL